MVDGKRRGLAGTRAARRMGAAALAAALALCLALPQASPAEEQGGSGAAASTKVELAIVSAFALERATPAGADAPDYVGTVEGARGRGLEARVEGAAGAVSATWARSVDGIADEGFSAAGLVHELSGDALESGRVYHYTLTARDEAATRRAAEFSVDVRYRTTPRIAHAPGSDQRVDVAGDAFYDGAHEASVHVERLAGPAAPGDALDVLARAAAQRGASVESAWSVGMSVPAGVDASPYVGALRVSFPYPPSASPSALPAQPPLMQTAALCGPDVLFLADGDDVPVPLSTVYENCRASFATPSLGTFVVLSGGPVITHVVTAEAGEGGSVSPQRARVPHGGEVTFSFFPDAGYRVAQVLVDGQEAQPGDSLTLRDVTADHAVQVRFEPAGQGGAGSGEQGAPKHVIRASATAHGSVSPEGEVAVAQGADASFAFFPEAGYGVSRVVVDGRALAFAPGSWTFRDVREDHTLQVEFAPLSALAPTGDAGGRGAVLLSAALCGLFGAIAFRRGRARS